MSIVSTLDYLLPRSNKEHTCTNFLALSVTANNFFAFLNSIYYAVSPGFSLSRVNHTATVNHLCLLWPKKMTEESLKGWLTTLQVLRVLANFSTVQKGWLVVVRVSSYLQAYAPWTTHNNEYAMLGTGKLSFILWSLVLRGWISSIMINERVRIIPLVYGYTLSIKHQVFPEIEYMANKF